MNLLPKNKILILLLSLYFISALNAQQTKFSYDIKIFDSLDYTRLVTIGAPALFFEGNLESRRKLFNIFNQINHITLPENDTIYIKNNCSIYSVKNIIKNHNYIALLNIEKELEIYEINIKNDANFIENYYIELFRILNIRKNPCQPESEKYDGLDNDCDGNIDEGLKYNNDFDYDGILDSLDGCPEVQGVFTQNGCPSSNYEIKYNLNYTPDIFHDKLNYLMFWEGKEIAESKKIKETLQGLRPVFPILTLNKSEDNSPFLDLKYIKFLNLPLDSNFFLKLVKNKFGHHAMYIIKFNENNYSSVLQNIINENDLDKDKVVDYLDNCIGISNKEQIDLDNDKIGDACDCNFANPDKVASTDSDNDGICDDKDKCINTFGKNPDGCPIKTDTITIKYAYNEKDNRLIGVLYQDTFPIKYSYSKHGNRISALSPDSISNEELESIDEYIEILKKFVFVHPENITIVNNSHNPFFKWPYTVEKYFIKKSSQQYFLNSVNKNRLKPSKFNDKIKWLTSKINNNNSLFFTLKTDKNTFEDCLQLLAIYLDSVQLDTSNLLYQDIIDESFQLLNSLLSINQNFTSNSLLNDKILSTMFIDDIITQNQVKGYLFPTICYTNNKDKKISKNTQAYYYTGRGALHLGLKHPFEYGNNPHYELFGQQNYYVKYFKNDTIPIKDSIYFTPIKNLSNISIKPYTLNPLLDKEGFKSIVMLDYLNQEPIKNANDTLVGLSVEQEKILYEKINEINLSQNKYFIVRSIPFYEHKK